MFIVPKRTGEPRRTVDFQALKTLTFITPWGRYGYLRAPQGYLASSDCFTYRDQLTFQDVKNNKNSL